MCNGICRRLYQAHRLKPGLSLYVGNKRCSNCERFISMEGVYKKATSYNCKCCNRPVRHTPYSGRKSIDLYKANASNIDIDKINRIAEDRTGTSKMEESLQQTKKY